MSDFYIKQALAKTARSLTGKVLTEGESQELLKSYRAKAGTMQDRITRSLAEQLNLTPEQINQKRAADDNTDRIFRDLVDELGK
jgi:hypothetical protein